MQRKEAEQDRLIFAGKSCGHDPGTSHTEIITASYFLLCP